MSALASYVYANARPHYWAALVLTLIGSLVLVVLS